MAIVRSSLFPIVVAGALLVAQITLGSCSRGSDVSTNSRGKIMAVHVKSDGTILVNGNASSLEQLKRELAALAKAGGTVRYSRDNPTGEPPPNAMEVIKAIVNEKLPVQMAVPGG